MSTDNVLHHPAFGRPLVKNPALRPGPRPKGVTSLAAVRRKRRLHQQSRERREAEKGQTVIQLVSRFLNLVPTLDHNALESVIRTAERLAQGVPVA